MRLPYKSEGASLLTNTRNDDQHLVESHSLDTASQPPVILLKYYQIMHIFGLYYPLFFCHFFQAMHSQGLVPNSCDKTLSHLMNKTGLTSFCGGHSKYIAENLCRFFQSFDQSLVNIQYYTIARPRLSWGSTYAGEKWASAFVVM
jgi:hypothetical protein